MEIQRSHAGTNGESQEGNSTGSGLLTPLNGADRFLAQLVEAVGVAERVSLLLPAGHNGRPNQQVVTVSEVDLKLC